MHAGWPESSTYRYDATNHVNNLFSPQKLHAYKQSGMSYSDDNKIQ